MKKEVKGVFTELEGQKVYKIENYDQMDDFFMTITSSSDIWNFCWSKGGITAGRINSNYAIFPYYTADKVSDAASYTGNYTCVQKGDSFWEPFATFHSTPSLAAKAEKTLIRNIYKNYNGSQVWFEEINTELELLFRTSWTSSNKYGVVRTSTIQNLGNAPVSIKILDGCQNILPACCTSDFQNSNSILLDAYKKTDVDTKANLALFSVSSIVSDKAEPNEGLYANTCWFSTDDKLLVDIHAPQKFVTGEELDYSDLSKGQRSSCFICKEEKLSAKEEIKWYQVFDTALTMPRVKLLENELKDKATLVKNLEADIVAVNDQLTAYIAAADGLQDTNNLMACLHHQQNVMFNIMRGGIFADSGKIHIADFIAFAKQRNVELSNQLKKVFAGKEKDVMEYQALADIIQKENNPQFSRMFFEYLPITFSRRHGDPSRPWNVFNIKLKDSQDNPILNYEGNWRDIFQNWESLAWSYPMYIKNMWAKFLNAMTIEGFNPYKINREGVDWETPEPNNPWAQYGYWGDHQVIYFSKLLEFYDKTNHQQLINDLDEKIFTSSNVPYRLKSYAEILKNPRSSISFDEKLSNELRAAAKTCGSDKKLICGKDGNPYLVSFTAKALQIVIAKAANFIPAGGIWLNTQRPEWNDANNALAGYGLSVVTTCYLYRYINVLISLYQDSTAKTVTIPCALKDAIVQLYDLYKASPADSASSDEKRKAFTDKAGLIFETQRNDYYKNGYNSGETTLEVATLIDFLKAVNTHVEHTIRLNKREDNLYHSYNTVKISDKAMTVEYLQEMLEGQVAVLSSGLLTPEEAQSVVKALETSKMYEPRQNSFMLYPNKVLPQFFNKNAVSANDAKELESLIARTNGLYLQKDCDGEYHFNSDFRNEGVVKEFINSQSDENKPTAAEQKKLLALYEKTFNHQSFTGRSGTFYAYEGLGSIYWHMVSKLLLAVQENLFIAKNNNDEKMVKELTESYFKVRKGLSYNKTPEIYGAFPQDPYSHTPNGQGAKQPGMTGQVKEEILTRFGELGIKIEKGIVSFEPLILEKCEIKTDNTLSFTWCGLDVTYRFTENAEDTITIGSKKVSGTALSLEESKSVLTRDGSIKTITVEFGKNFKGL